MDVNSLMHDEFMVECEVRNLVGSHLVMYESLIKALEAEGKVPVLIPNRAHERARKNPQREIDNCARKLCYFKQELQDNIPTMSEDDMNKIISRLMHVNGRLLRISNSPKYRESALSYLKIGEILLLAIQTQVADSANLNQSIESIKNVQLTAPGEEGSDTEEVAESQSNPNESIKKIPINYSETSEKVDSATTNPHITPSSQGAFDKTVISPPGAELYNLLEQIQNFVKPIPKTLSYNSDESSDSTPREVLGYPKSNTRAGTVPKVRFSLDNHQAGTSNQFARQPELTAPSSSSTAQRSGTCFDVNQIATEELIKIIQSRFENMGKPFQRSPSFQTSKPVSSSTSPLSSFNPYIPPPINPINHNFSQAQSNIPPWRNVNTTSTASAAEGSFNLGSSASIWPNLPVCNPSDFQPPPRSHRKPDTWNLHFEGSKKDLISIERFLKRVERMALRYNISQIRLVDELSFLLKGEALEWYWTYLEKMGQVSWIQIKTELIRRFQIRKTDDDIYREMSNRKQDYPKEPFYEYYSALLKLSMQLRNPMTDHELLRFLKSNMRPGLHLVLANQLNYIRTIDQLVERCVEYEELWNKFGHCPESGLRPQARSVNEILSEYPTAASIDPEYSIPEYSPTLDVNELNFHATTFRPPVPRYADVPKKTNQTPPNVPHITCYNCNQVGHYANVCPLLKSKPAESPTVTFVCSKCQSKSENVEMEGRSNSTPLHRNLGTSETKNAVSQTNQSHPSTPPVEHKPHRN